MLKKYNTTAELLITAKIYKERGKKADALKLLWLAMEEEDSDELLEILDTENEALDPEAMEEVESEADKEKVEEKSVPEIEEVISKIRDKKIALKASASRRMETKSFARPSRPSRFRREESSERGSVIRKIFRRK
jgi:uncharacterized protein (DUF2336 family)